MDLDNMEDGELLSSEDEEAPPPPHNSAEITFQDDIFEDSSYVIIERPKSSLPVPSKSSASTAASTTATQRHDAEMTAISNYQEQRQPTMSTVGNVQHRPPQAACDADMLGDRNAYDQFRKTSYYKKAGVSDLLGSSEESSSASDSDDDEFHGKRSRMIMPSGQQHSSLPNFSTATASSSMGCASNAAKDMHQCPPEEQSAALNDFFAEASKFQKQRKPNQVWSNVIQEEEISKALGQQVRVGGGLAEVEVTRGSETYYYERARRQPRRRRDSDSSDISSGGLSDNALHYLKDGMASEDDEAETAEEPSEHALPTSFTSGGKNKSNSRKGTKRRRTSKKLKRKIINKLKKMKPMDLAKYMAGKLHEEKSQLICRTIQTLGKDKCIHFFLKTLKIEKRGGIMTKSLDRRRTAGGVFFYQIRWDPRLSKSDVDFIFREDRAVFEKQRKKRIASKRLRNKADLESAKEVIEEGDAMKLDESEGSESDNDTVILDEKDQDAGTTDTGQYGDDSTQEDSSTHEKDPTAEELSGFIGMQCDGSEA